MRKILLFGLLGALGCVLAALPGEFMLRSLRARAATVTAAPPEILFSQDLADRLQREKAASGDVQIALSWNNDSDLDLHCIEPSGEEISFENRRCRSGGFLDVDQNDAPPFLTRPVEHIVWPSDKPAPVGDYRVVVVHRARRRAQDPTAFVCQVVVNGTAYETFTRTWTGTISRGETREIGRFTIVRRDLAKPTLAQQVRALGTTALWTGLLATGLALALVVGQNLYLHRRPLSAQQALVLLIGSLLAGDLAGGGGQALFSYFDRLPLPQQLADLSPGLRDELGRFLGWLLLGGLLGLSLGGFLPNLARGRAALAGALGAFVAAWAFVDISRLVGDQFGRLAGAAILGLFLGTAIALVEATYRVAWLEVVFGPQEKRRVSLGIEPVSVGSDPECTVYAAKAPAVALRFRLDGGKVLCEDLAAGTTAQIQAGEARQVGGLTVLVCGDLQNGKPAAGNTVVASAAGWALRLASGPRLPLREGRQLTPADLPGIDAAGSSVAEVVRHPQDPTRSGLKNMTSRTWTATVASGEKRAIEPGRSIQLAPGTRIDFGSIQGEIEAHSAPRGDSRAPRALGCLVFGVIGIGLLAWLAVLDARRRHPTETGLTGTRAPQTAPVVPTGPRRPTQTVLSGHRDRVHSVAFSPDGTLVASASRDQTVRVWRVADGKQLHELKGHTDAVRSVAFRPDGKVLASSSADRTIRLWNVEDGRTLHTIDNVLGAGIAFSPNGEWLAGPGRDGRLRLWRGEDGQPAGVLDGQPECLAFSPDGGHLVGGEGRSLRFWDVRRRVPLRTVPGLRNLLHCVAVNRDGTLMVGSQCLQGSLDDKTGKLKAGIPDEFVRVYRVADGQVVHTFPTNGHCVTSVAFSPTDESLLASAGGDRGIKLWRLPAGELVDTLEGHTKEVWAIAFSPDGRMLASGGNDWSVRLWPIADRARPR